MNLKLNNLTYKVQISVKRNHLLHKLFLWQQVSTLLSHLQAFKEKIQCINIHSAFCDPKRLQQMIQLIQRYESYHVSTVLSIVSVWNPKLHYKF